MLEILASKIRNVEEIKGLPFQNMTNNKSIKIVHHADDCTNLLRNAKSLKKLLKLISEFSEVAGPKPNLKKPECLLTVSFRNMYADEKT